MAIENVRNRSNLGDGEDGLQRNKRETWINRKNKKENVNEFRLGLEENTEESQCSMQRRTRHECELLRLSVPRELRNLSLYYWDPPSC